MSAMDFKKNTDLDFPSYAPPAVSSKEIDLLGLLDILITAKKRIATIIFVFALAGLAIALLLPQKWTSKAVITPAEQTQWNPLRQMMVALQVLDVKVPVTRQEVFDLFIKKFQSQSLLEEYITSSPYVMAQLKNAQVDPLELHRAVVNIADRMKAVNDVQGKDADKAPFVSWTLSFTAPTAADAQSVLEGYINYISAIVEKETVQNIRNQIALKTNEVEQQLTLDRVRLTNVHNTNLQRLNYSLEVANAAGIKKPVYSNGQGIKDDPDYSVALGADGIAEKLRIEKNLKDVTELNADFQNREYYLAQLKKLSFADVKLEPFRYQLSPSMPVKKDGPGKGMIVILAAILGALFACGSVLLREAMLSRNPLPEPVTE
ncbi:MULTISPECIES: LPS O-antigen length regulator Wzz(fepE) [unclassified Enterobacter cloacae complex]|uniref:LPS O-antigen length regulator Wzz(fepE) n=1 Tax=unclassified Enterobacter cloacae complex TaxID=2757714 RepID=UPI0018730B6F|nr:MULTISPECIES: LPS O-antigen length regulator Wzz(fepE) [unclassified Enterobacter cloacae complex]HDS2774028.1 LPS O-antigen length regulator [Enterobacter bugandensis]MBE4810089.1 LPS O-antigen length regulator [Enterobacter cloacae complex sp. P44RS]MBE4827927.1 LPS O-antigen length regulator [Enterobacter cloacae complex sp. P42RS]MBE4836233.1 LPS O-antigen length regulator [Enterobacter cloacae complex sp. P46RS]MBE4839866.1 LPS O-antigen length regulator [Enterobacter cloacae complex s